MLLGMLPMFKHCGPRAAIGAILSGFLAFIVIKSFSIVLTFSVEVSLPLIVSFVSYLFFGILNRGKEVSPEVIDMFKSLDKRDTA
ncbi:MAG: Na+:solute symporter, partial [Bacteroidota bacterium]